MPTKKAKEKLPVPAARVPSTKDAGRREDGSLIPHQRTDEVAELVCKYARMGASDNDIAIMLDIRPGQLRQYYAKELDTAKLQADVKVSETIYKAATHEESPSLRAAFFWAERRMGWVNKEEKATSPLLINIHL